MNDQAASPGCPDLETLTAVFDGELGPDEAVRAHLSTCPDCARRLADYAVLRGHVSRIVASEPDAGFNARISAFVRAEASKDAPRFSLSAPKRDFSDSRAAWIFRIAALFILSGFFVYLLMDQLHANRPSGGRTYAVAGTAHPSAKPVPVMDSGTGDFVKARLVSNAPSSRQYAIDIDPMLIPDEFDDIPVNGSIPVPLPWSSDLDGGTTHRIPLRADPSLDVVRMLESIRRDLAALDDLPGLSVDAENRGNSLFTTIRVESAGKIDMSMKKTDGMFEFFLMSGSAPDDGEGPVSFQIEFFCE